MDINQKLQAFLRSVADNKGKAGAAAITTVLLLLIVDIYRQDQNHTKRKNSNNPMNRLGDFTKKWGIASELESDVKSTTEELINDEKKAKKFLIDLFEIIKDLQINPVKISYDYMSDFQSSINSIINGFEKGTLLALSKLGNKIKGSIKPVNGILCDESRNYEIRVKPEEVLKILHGLCRHSELDTKIIRLLLELGTTINDDIQYIYHNNNDAKHPQNALDMLECNKKSTPELYKALLLIQLEVMTVNKAQLPMEVIVHSSKLSEKLLKAIQEINKEHSSEYKIENINHDNNVKIIMDLVEKKEPVKN